MLKFLIPLLILSSSCAHAQVTPDVPTQPSTVFKLGKVDDINVGLMLLELMAAQTAGVTDITIEIDSPGGSVDQGLKLIKAIESFPNSTCVVRGGAFSMALTIMQSCKTRVMTKSSVLMAHDLSFVMEENRSLNGIELQTMLDEQKALSTALAARICARSTLEWSECRSKVHNNWWLDYEQATKAGMVDKVLP